MKWLNKREKREREKGEKERIVTCGKHDMCIERYRDLKRKKIEIEIEIILKCNYLQSPVFTKFVSISFKMEEL